MYRCSLVPVTATNPSLGSLDPIPGGVPNPLELNAFFSSEFAPSSRACHSARLVCVLVLLAVARLRARHPCAAAAAAGLWCRVENARCGIVRYAFAVRMPIHFFDIVHCDGY